MASTPVTFGNTTWELPPLILYPFNEKVAPSSLLESSKAALMLAGLIPADGSDMEDLRRRVLTGRYAEIRMLFFLGKDVLRWIEQCRECAQKIPELSQADIRAQSFAGLLTTSPPDGVREKLIRWGVADYAALFARGIGVKSIFVHPPSFDLLTAEFLASYHQYAESLYRSFMELQPHQKITGANFPFDLYASGEYTRLLEDEWREP